MSEIRNAPTTVQNVVTYDVVVKVANPELKLKPGMTANVSIITAAGKGCPQGPERRPPFQVDSRQALSDRGKRGAPAGGGAGRGGRQERGKGRRASGFSTGRNPAGFP